jgi:three-Cys-motif partner protein
MDDDGLSIAEVGVWVPQEKHARLRRYIDISRGARKKFLGAGTAGATYIDLFSGPGKAKVRETGEIIDGSAVLAYKVSVEGGAPFSALRIADIEAANAQACRQRLESLNAPVQSYVGPATETVKAVVKDLNGSALHFAFLDPFNLEALPFQVIADLAQLTRVDMLIHISAQDLQRNLRRYLGAAECPLDAFAPGWRDVTDPVQSDEVVRRQIREHWLRLIQKLDMEPSQGIELVAGGKNQPLYWLVLVSRNKRAHEFWDKIREVGPQRRLPL